MSVAAAILGLASGQPPGTTDRHMCPKCLGGSSEEQSLNLTVAPDGGIWWICWRASCGYKGGPRGQSPATQATKKEPRIYTREIIDPPAQQREVLHKLFGTEFPQTNIGYNHDSDRFLLPVLGPKFNQHRGYIARSFSGASPKTVNYGEDVPFIHFAYPKRTARRYAVVVVEDWFSAEKVAQAGFTGVSINGTNLNQEIVNELVEQKQAVILAFDRDAFAKSVGYQTRYKEQFPLGLYIAKLDKDLKYVGLAEITEIVEHAGRISVGSDPKGQESV